MPKNNKGNLKKKDKSKNYYSYGINKNKNINTNIKKRTNKNINYNANPNLNDNFSKIQKITTTEIKQTKEKKNNTMKKIMGLAIIMTLLGIGCACAFTSPLFNISSIEIKGNKKIESSTYMKLSKLKVNTNIFKFRESEIISNIKENTYVENVRIKRLLPSTVEITIKERETKFQISTNNEEFAYIDENGNILEISHEKIPTKPILAGNSTENKKIKPGEKLEETDIDKIKDIIIIENACKNNEIESFDIADISNRFNYILTFEKEAKRVYIGSADNLETKILFMKSLLEKQAGVPGEIHLEVSRVYFSPE